MGRGANIMTDMISVIEWVSGQSFQSKKLATHYFKIPRSLIDKSIKNKKEVVSKAGKKFRFTLGGSRRLTSTVHKPKTVDGQTLNFGKHKNVPMRDIPLQYLVWAYDNVSRCPKCVEIELKKRKGELI